MTEETKTESNVEQSKSEETKATKAETSEQKKEEPKVEKETKQEDPTLSRLLAAERRLEEMSSELEKSKAQIKTYEREGRKSSILSALADAFPGLPREELRGAALVAQEDGKVDLYSADTAKQVSALKELLKTKKPSVPQPSLGGTPGNPAKPQQANNVRNRFPI